MTKITSYRFHEIRYGVDLLLLKIHQFHQFGQVYCCSWKTLFRLSQSLKDSLCWEDQSKPALADSFFIGGSWARSPTRMMEMPPKQSCSFFGNACHSLLSILNSSFGPMKLNSSIRMYLICFNSSCNVVNACPCSCCNYLIGILSTICIVDARMLNVA